MAKFISISGPASTGKTSLIDSLSTHTELSGAIFSPDLYNTVWSDLVRQGIFQEYTELVKDSAYVVTYISKLINYYTEYIETMKYEDGIVFLDCCWMDLLVYSMINMWCTNTMKSLQESILGNLSSMSRDIDRCYLTVYNRSLVSKVNPRSRIYTLKSSRGLEMQYYDLFKNFKNCQVLPSSDVSESSLFIINDLKDLGYLSK